MHVLFVQKDINVGKELRSWVYFGKILSADWIESVVKSDSDPLDEILFLGLEFLDIVSSEVLNLIFDIDQFLAIGSIWWGHNDHVL